MSIKEIDISVGSESQVAVTTSLTTTTAEARDRFQPMERGCYFEGELSLKYLPKQFYRWVNKCEIVQHFLQGLVSWHTVNQVKTNMQKKDAYFLKLSSSDEKCLNSLDTFPTK